MAVTFGFYNSINHDRLYNALQLSSIFDGIIMDGVFMSIGSNLIVTPSSPPSLDVVVGIGKAWFNHTWTVNDSPLVLTVDAPDVLHARMDTVVLEVNGEDASRTNSIKIIKGTPAVTPYITPLVNTEVVHQYMLGVLWVSANTAQITQADITNKVGTSDCPFVTGPLKTIDATALIAQWQAQYTNWLSSEQNNFQAWLTVRSAEFTDWFATLHTVLDGDVGGHLQNEIDANGVLIDALTTNYSRIQMDLWNSVVSIAHLSIIVDLTNGDDETAMIHYDTGQPGRYFRTVQAAIDTITSKIISENSIVDIRLTNGPCSEEIILRQFSGGGKIRIWCTNELEIHASYAASCFATDLSGPGEYSLEGFKLQSSGASGNGISVDSGFLVHIKNINFGTFVSGNHIKVCNGGRVVSDGNGYKVSGPCAKHVMAYNNALLDTKQSTVLITTNPTAIGCWLDVSRCAIASVIGMTFTNKNYVTGKRYNTYMHAVIDTNYTANDTYLPGNQGGTQNWGLYN